MYRSWRRVLDADSAVVADVGIAVAGLTLTALAGFAPSGVIGVAVDGPLWMRLLLPPAFAAALLVRRRAPLLMWASIWAVVAVQYAITRHPPQGLEWFVPLAGAYSLGAHAVPRWTGVGLAAVIVAMLIVRPGLSLIPLVFFCLAGVFVRTRCRAAALEQRNVALRRQAEQAAADERARIARELHDIVAHHLSVIVLQASGARATGRGSETTALEKIEASARQALTDTRHLLDVLRDRAEVAGTDPHHGIDDLEALASSVRAAGIPVRLEIGGDRHIVPAAVDVSVYRVVQEALTNVVRHTAGACVDVTVACSEDGVTVEVADTGPGRSLSSIAAGGHGLAVMRERVAVFGGELSAAPRDGGGFLVRARFPLQADLPSPQRVS